MARSKKNSAPAKRKGTKAKRAKPSSRDYLRALGPGLVTGASDDDPSGIATYAQAGASHGLGLLWTSLLTFPLMAAVQEICDRTALATGTTLGGLAAKRFQRVGRYVVTFLIVVLIIANALNVAADLVAIGSGMKLLHLGPTWLWALVAGVVITIVITFGSFNKIALIFKVLCLSLFSYIIVAIIVTHDWLAVLRNTVVPDIQFNRTYLALLVAILGTTISPYLFFWQNAERLEDMRNEPEGGDLPMVLASRGTAAAALKEKMSRFDVFSGMGFSNIVMFAIIVTASATLHAHHLTTIDSAAQAATSLKPFAGRFASAIFAFGFIGSGFLAVPVLAASGSVGLAGILGKEWGLSKSVRKAPFFYALVALGTFAGTALSLLNVNPIKLLVFVAVINGVTAAPLLFVVMRISSSRELMGKYVNGHAANILGWATVSLMGVAAIALFATGGVSF
jgi:NRAMP (natural resistance-associated macrophage protein)-like metal ion transporter